MAYRYISDMHLDHGNIIAFDNRPFKSVNEMNRVLIENWNNVTSSNDTVIIAGDFCWTKEPQWIKFLQQLNGDKVLVRGNHDLKNMSSALKKMFLDIKDYKEVDDNGRKVVVCHYPIPCFKNHFYGWYHLYGHVHNSFEARMMEHDKFLMQELYGKQCEMFNVGCMMPYMNYTPRTLDEIIQGANGQ